METMVIKEEPIIRYEPAWANEALFEEGLCLYKDDLVKADIGTCWRTEDVDRYPNANYRFEVLYKKVYQDDDGVCLLENIDGILKLLWFEFGKPLNSERHTF